MKKKIKKNNNNNNLGWSGGASAPSRPPLTPPLVKWGASLRNGRWIGKWSDHRSRGALYH